MSRLACWLVVIGALCISWALDGFNRPGLVMIVAGGCFSGAALFLHYVTGRRL